MASRQTLKQLLVYPHDGQRAVSIQNLREFRGSSGRRVSKRKGRLQEVNQYGLPEPSTIPTGTYLLINRSLKLPVKPQFNLTNSEISCHKYDYSDSFKWILDHAAQTHYTIQNRYNKLYAHCGSNMKPPRNVQVQATPQYYDIKRIPGVYNAYSISTIDSAAFIGLHANVPDARLVIGTADTSELFQWYIVPPQLWTP